VGRPRLTTEEKQLTGTLKKSREKEYSQREERAETQVSRELYPDPSFIKAERNKFEELVGLLENNPKITSLDSPALQTLARLLVELRTVEKFLKKHSHTYQFKNREGEISYRRRPESVLRAELVATTDRQLNDFGLTPKARGVHQKHDSKKAPVFDMFPGRKKKPEEPKQ
jgi:hypothetical protein